MMTRNIRKIVSILCAVALLLSLCMVSFIGSSSAKITAQDDVTSTEVWETTETVVDYDFSTPTGIAFQRYLSSATYVDGAVRFKNQGGGGQGYIAKPTYTGTIGKYDASGAYDNALSLEANATYKLTFRYKLVSGSNSSGLSVYFAPNATNTTPHATNYITSIKKDIPTYAIPSGETLTADSDWMEATYVFTVKDQSVNIGFRPEAANKEKGQVGIMDFDYVKIEKGSLKTETTLNDFDNTYVFDYTDETNQAQLTERMAALTRAQKHYSWYNYGDFFATTPESDANYTNYKAFADSATYPGGQPGFTDEGLEYQIAKGGTLKDGSNGWYSNAPIYDPDTGNNDGWGNLGTKYLRLRDEASYIITVKYKVKELNAKVNLAVGTLVNCVKGSATVVPGSIVTIREASDEWQYLTVTVDTAENTALVDQDLTLVATTTDKTWSTLIINSVTVKEKRDTANGVAIVETYNDGVLTAEFATPGTVHTLDVPENTDDKGFAGWYTSSMLTDETKVDIANYVPAKGVNKLYAKWVNTKCDVMLNENGTVRTVKMAVGETLPRANRPDSRLFFEGWYSDAEFTQQVTTVPEQSTITLYAKYTGIYLEFNNKSHAEGTGTPEIVVDPDDANNNVVKFEAGNNSRPNFALPAFDGTDAGAFRLETNTTYYYSFKVKTLAGSDKSNVDFYQGSGASGTAHARTSLFSAGGFAENKTEEVGDWVTLQGSFTTGDTFYLERVKWAYQDKLFFTTYPGNGDTNKDGVIDGDEKEKHAAIYIDDMIIYKALDEAPAGTSTISFETNGPEIADIYGFAGEALTLPTPELGGYKFVEWCTDKKLTNKFTSTTFTAEDITLYAKWESADFVVDFEGYNESGTLSRAKVIEVDGNWLMDYKTEYSTLTDFNTLYRAHVNKNSVCFQVSEGATYIVSFDYKLTRGTLSYGAVTNGRYNGWTNYVVQKKAGTISELTDEWKTVTFEFTATNPDKIEDNWNYFALGLAGDCDAQIDNVKILSTTSTANLYGSIILTFIPNEGESVDPISGEPGEALGTLPKTTRSGYKFNGWYADAECTTPFTATTFAEENMFAYAGWLLGEFKEGYEDFPTSVVGMGISGAYKLYNTTNFADYNKANVHNGSVSIYRDGSQTGNKAFTLCRSTELALTPGKEYKLTFYVKPDTIIDAAGTISLIGMDGNTGINAPKSTNVITTVGELKAGEWQKVSYTFTADTAYIGISTTAGNNMYLDNFTVTLDGYEDESKWGDSTVSPMVLSLMILLAAGALVVTGKKVFEK